MAIITQSASIIRPKRPFVTWANAHSHDDREFSLEYFRESQSLAILIPVSILERNPGKLIGELWENIFIEQLSSWNPSEYSWPPYPTRKMFSQWFQVEFCAGVIEFDSD